MEWKKVNLLIVVGGLTGRTEIWEEVGSGSLYKDFMYRLIQ